MTDLAEPLVAARAAQVAAALNAPYDPTATLIRRFGFEYEMLPSSGGSDYEEYPSYTFDLDPDFHSVETYVEVHMDEYDGEVYDTTPERQYRDRYGYRRQYRYAFVDGTFADDDVDDGDGIPKEHDAEMCNCEECVSDRRDNYRSDLYDRAWNDGYCDDPPGRGGDAEALINQAYRHRLISHTDQHSYHCSCRDCRHDRTSPLMTAQRDSTVGVEFVSRICDLTPATLDEIGSWVDMMHRWKSDGGWMPDGFESCGNHIHVEQPNSIHSARTLETIDALYAAFDWDRVVDGGCGRVRSYNAKPNKDSHMLYSSGSSWCSDTGYGTFEHRAWNTPSDPDRLWAAIGISIGLQRYAYAIAKADPAFEIWDTSQPNHWGERRSSISDETFAALKDNRDVVIAQIASYIPTDPRFDVARSVINNLR